MLWGVGAVLEHAPTASPFAQSVGHALRNVGTIFFAMYGFSWLFDARGVAVKHFLWPPFEAMQAVKRAIRLFMLVYVPTVFVALMNSAVYAPHVNRESLGRIAFIFGMVALSLFVYRPFRRSGSGDAGSVAYRRYGALEDDEEGVPLGRDCSIPPAASTAGRRMAWWRSSSGPNAGPRALAERVKPSMSVNMNVSVPTGRKDDARPGHLARHAASIGVAMREKLAGPLDRQQRRQDSCVDDGSHGCRVAEGWAGADPGCCSGPPGGVWVHDISDR